MVRKVIVASSAAAHFMPHGAFGALSLTEIQQLERECFCRFEALVCCETDSRQRQALYARWQHHFALWSSSSLGCSLPFPSRLLSSLFGSSRGR